MDIINVALRGDIHTLPLRRRASISEWEDVRKPGFFGDPETAYSKTSVVHFTAVGKPWSYRPEEVRQLRPHAHAIFHEVCETWWNVRQELHH